jgi:hypothetical protein
MMPRIARRGGSQPHAKYGVDLAEMPDTHVPPERFMSKLEQVDGALTKCSPLGGDRCCS